MRAASLTRVALAVSALAGVLVAAAGLLTPDAGWPRADVLGGLGVALAASVAWWFLAPRSEPADGTFSRFGWWPAHRRIVADLVLVVGGICVLALPSAVNSAHPDLVTLRGSHPVIRQVNVTSVKNVSRRRGRGRTTYYADVTAEVSYPVGPPREVTERIVTDDDPRPLKAVYALYAPSRPQAGLLLDDDRGRLEGLLRTGTPTWLVVAFLLGLALIAVRAVRVGPPGGWRAQARLRRALGQGIPVVVLEGRLEPSALAADTTLPAEFHTDDAGGTIRFDEAFDPQRMKDGAFAGTVRLCWLPDTRPTRRGKLHAAILVADNGRFAPVGIRALPPARPTDQVPALDRLDGPFRRTGGGNRGLFVLATVVAVGVLCSGVLVPERVATTSGSGFDNDSAGDLSVLLTCQVCLLIMPLVVIAYFRAATPDSRPRDRPPAAEGDAPPTG
ncbi:hypothetical protein AB0J90_11035 [Micromonospora sp. NPDC049523]|uniref:hypothetical protein n=1 Tax=Micromonospora sp. NPDC049523 TaxID=3155921 RepID=UPI0034257F60